MKFSKTFIARNDNSPYRSPHISSCVCYENIMVDQDRSLAELAHTTEAYPS